MDGYQRCNLPIDDEVISGNNERISHMATTLDDVTEAMKDVIDPELGINVVDLGLIYDISIDNSNVAVLDMTLTSAACPLQDVIEDQTRSVLQDLVSDVKINWVWMPPWGPDKITDDGREQLRAIGFTV
jgi:metal-sulfur cluster biosynthetic enzyme